MPTSNDDFIANGLENAKVNRTLEWCYDSDFELRSFSEVMDRWGKRTDLDKVKLMLFADKEMKSEIHYEGSRLKIGQLQLTTFGFKDDIERKIIYYFGDARERREVCAKRKREC